MGALTIPFDDTVQLPLLLSTKHRSAFPFSMPKMANDNNTHKRTVSKAETDDTLQPAAKQSRHGAPETISLRYAYIVNLSERGLDDPIPPGDIRGVFLSYKDAVRCVQEQKREFLAEITAADAGIEMEGMAAEILRREERKEKTQDTMTKDGRTVHCPGFDPDYSDTLDAWSFNSVGDLRSNCSCWIEKHDIQWPEYVSLDSGCTHS
ncbi:hypothetical protein F5B20DRAFT_48628 [Whalleya microplaca]|nr:hypothetical protein F5B20DRAFT_48628 [Whalleya microplaca]